MVIKIEIYKQETLYNNGFEWGVCIFVNNNFYKEIGGLSAYKELLKILLQELYKIEL